jgi:Flp pilus assembly protein TadG
MLRRELKRERGMTLILAALCMFVFIGIAALAVDVGVLYTARASAQNAADAGALAGAFTFVNNPVAIQPAYAKDQAVRTTNQNKVLGTPVTITAANVTVDLINQRVTVVVPRTASTGNPVATYFAKIFGINSADIVASAAAEASTTPSAAMCLKPIYVPNTVLSSETPTKACADGQIIFDSSGNLTGYSSGKAGQAITVRPLGGGSGYVPSQWGSIDFGSGASTYRCSIESCLPQCGVDPRTVSCGTSFLVETGNMDGPTRQGIGNLLGSTPDQWQGVGKYLHNGLLTDTSQELVTVVIWDNCKQSISPGTQGQTVRVAGFGSVFITGIDSNGVAGRFVGAASCGTGGGPGGTGPLAIPVRLVQAPPAS